MYIASNIINYYFKLYNFVFYNFITHQLINSNTTSRYINKNIMPRKSTTKKNKIIVPITSKVDELSISDDSVANNQLCVVTELFQDNTNNEVTFNVSYPACPNVSNQLHLELTKYHISLLLSLTNKNCDKTIENKMLHTRPTSGQLCGDMVDGVASEFRLSNDDYEVFKSLTTIIHSDESSSSLESQGIKEVTDNHVNVIDTNVTQELSLRLDSKCKPVLFVYGQTIISDFFKYHKSTYDLITCLTVKLLLHPKLVDRIDTILKIRPAYIETLTYTYSSSNKGGDIIINNDHKYKITDMVVKIQEFVSILSNAFEDAAGSPNLEDLETELFLQCGMSYDLMRESVINFNQFQLVDMDTQKTLLGMVTSLRPDDSKNKQEINKDLKRALNSVQMFRVKYNHQELSREFDGGKNLLFHGSPMINWHSLLYNGPYVPDKKNGLIDNGAVHGIGVYLSPTSNLSIGYTGYQANRMMGASGIDDNFKQIDKYGNSKVMLGIFQIRGDMSRYKKTPTIYVCPDTDQLCLKYLVYGSYQNISSITTQLDNFCRAGAETIVQNTKQRQGRRGAKRLMGEIKQMNARNGQLCDDGLLFNFNLVGDSINIWKISMPMEDNFRDLDHKKTSSNQPQIYQDARKYKVDNLDIEITFPDDYPFGPPFVRVVYPRFMFMTGHITSGGSVCTELLTRGGWVATTSVISLILMLKQNMYDGGARIDPKKLGQSYGYDEASAAYNRMLRNHPEWQAKSKSQR